MAVDQAILGSQSHHLELGSSQIYRDDQRPTQFLRLFLRRGLLTPSVSSAGILARVSAVCHLRLTGYEKYNVHT